jgi:5-formaminoimidazole-4-carboxamide-1-beta-D-ribofuranosyl 5'-monophosphate synthetase
MKKISGFILIILLASCSANYHLRKAIKKGYRCDEVADTIRITTVDSFPVIRDNQIVYERYFTTKDTIVQYKASFVPKTRYQTRIEYKLKRDTLRLIEKVEVIKYKKDKNDSKKPNLWLFIIGFGAGFITKWLLKFSKYTL